MREKFVFSYEEKRVEALKLYDILDTLPEKEYDDITQLASQICNTPIALISLIDEERQWFKSKVGLDVDETARSISFCTYAIQSDGIFEITDPLNDERFSGNPLVTGHPDIRFYAGAPLINKDGYRVGTLCVINSVPHHITEEQRNSLRILARSVISLLELRREKKEAELFRKALDEVAIVSVLDADLRYEYVNEKFLALAGMPEKEIIGTLNTDLNLADITEEQISMVMDAISERRIYRGKIKNQNRRGVSSWSNLTVIPFTNNEDNIIKILSLRNDITAEELMRERLEEAEAISKMGNWELNLVNGSRYWSRGLYAMMELPFVDGAGYGPSLLDMVSPADKERMIAAFQETVKGRSKQDAAEYKVITATGKEKDIYVNIKNRLNAKGELTGLYGTVQDITERKAAERAVEEHYLKVQDLYNNAPCGYHSVDAAGMFTDVNDTELKWMGYSREEVVGKLRLKDVFDGPDPAQDPDFINLKKTGVLKDKEALLKHRDGSAINVLISATTLKDEHGNFMSTRSTLYDVTELKKTQQELQENEAKYRKLVEESAQMSYTTAADGSVNYVSARLKKVLGYDDEEIIGTKFPFIYDDEWRKKTIIFYVQQLADQIEETNFLFPIKTKSGEKLWMEQNAILARENGEITGFRCIMFDVTARVRTEEIMQEATRLATEAKEMQQNFLGKMSHEIRTPMNGVLGMVNLLSISPLTDMQREYVAGIRESGMHMLRIINDILDVTKIQAGKMTFEEAEFDLPQLVNNVIFSLKPVADEKNVLIASHVDNKIPHLLIADALRLNQILLNLAGNALKFTEKGSVIVSVAQKEIKAETVTLEFRITDTGIGIAKDKIDTIFESFTQAETDTTRKYGGTGLGLTIVKQLVEQQKGEIKVNSTPGEGTTFTFTFHCKLVPAKTKGARPTEKAAGMQSLNGIRILLVEDNIMNQKVARYTLENWGAGVTIADRGRKAVDLMRQNKYDVVLMDLQMPEMNGMQAARIIRDELQDNTPIIAMTASAMRGEKENCIAAGMNDYISKPFEPHELNRMIYAYLPHSDEAPPARILDLDFLKKLVNNETQLIKEILELYIAKTPAALADLAAQLAEKNYDALYNEIHNLKNSVGLFGQGKLYMLLNEVEAGLYERVPDAPTIARIGMLKAGVTQSVKEAQEALQTMQ